MAETIYCSRCNSTNLIITKRELSDVLATWAQYVLNFLFSGFGKDLNPGATTASELRFDRETHRGLATGRWFWRCRDCGEKGAIFDEDVASPDPLAPDDRTSAHLTGETWRLGGPRDGRR
jgi:hypothetical protein